MTTVTVNGVSVTVPSDANISVVNGTLFVNGEPWKDGKLEGIVTLKVEGGVFHLKVDRGNVEVAGDVAGNIACGGSVIVSGNIGGNVEAGGSVQCGDVKKDVDAGGSVRCGAVGGKVDAGGSVRHG